MQTSTTHKIWNRNFTLLASSNFLTCINYYLMVSTLPLYLSHNFTASKSQVGIIMAAFMIASVCIRPFAGYALDKYGRRHIFITALTLNAILFALFITATHLNTLIILRIAQGLLWGIITISGSIVAADTIPPHKRGEGFGYYGLSTTFAMAIGPLAGIYLTSLCGYNGLFLCCVATSTISLICCANIQHRTTKQNNNIPFSIHSLFDKNSLHAACNLLIIMSAYGGLLSFIALYGKEIGVTNTSWFFLIFAIGIALSRFTIGRIFDTRGPKRMLTRCLLLLIASFIFLALTKNTICYFTSGIVLGFGIGAVFPGFQTMINNMVTIHRRGAANSTLYTSLDLGMGLGMILTGYISQHFSISHAFLLCALIVLVGLIYFRKTTAPLYQQRKIC